MTLYGLETTNGFEWDIAALHIWWMPTLYICLTFILVGAENAHHRASHTGTGRSATRVSLLLRIFPAIHCQRPTPDHVKARTVRGRNDQPVRECISQLPGAPVTNRDEIRYWMAWVSIDTHINQRNVNIHPWHYFSEISRTWNSPVMWKLFSFHFMMSSWLRL